MFIREIILAFVILLFLAVVFYCIYTVEETTAKESS